jgi:phage terminase small subunit
MLTPRQKRFVHEYLIDLNATHAAIRAGYSKKTADVQGPRLLGNVGVQTAIAAGKKKLTDKLDVTAERVVAEYAKLAYSDITEFAEWETSSVKLKSSSDLSRQQTAAIQEISNTPNGVKIKLHDKKGALDSLSRYLGIFNDNINVRVTVLDERMKNSRARAAERRMAENGGGE